MDDVISNYRRAGEQFAAVVAQGGGRWTNPSPCPGWDARAVVEHVIGVNNDFLLRPAGTEAKLRGDDPEARWSATLDAVDSAIAAAPELEGVLPALMGDVLVHTWDL